MAKPPPAPGRETRLYEKQRYLAANKAALPDAAQRWAAYEQLIWNKYGRGQPLDVAWKIRDWVYGKPVKRGEW